MAIDWNKWTDLLVVDEPELRQFAAEVLRDASVEGSGGSHLPWLERRAAEIEAGR